MEDNTQDSMEITSQYNPKVDTKVMELEVPMACLNTNYLEDIM